jgi:hypothetical protein
MASNQRWIITVSTARPISEIAADLTAAGLQLDDTLDQVGVIVGTAPADRTDRFRAIPGVVDVSPETQVDIGPPDSPHTW